MFNLTSRFLREEGDPRTKGDLEHIIRSADEAMLEGYLKTRGKLRVLLVEDLDLIQDRNVEMLKHVCMEAGESIGEILNCLVARNDRVRPTHRRRWHRKPGR